MKLSEVDILLGQYLIGRKSDVFVKKWTREVAQWKRILAAIVDADESEEIREKREELTHLIDMVEEVLR